MKVEVRTVCCGTFPGPRDSSTADASSFPDVPFSFGAPFLQGPGCFHCWGVCIHPALSAWSIPSQRKCGDTSSRKPSWIRCLDSGSHSPGLTSTLGGWAPGGPCLFLPLSSHRAVSPWGQVRHSWLSFPASSTQPGREEGHKCRRTKVRFFLSNVRSL